LDPIAEKSINTVRAQIQVVDGIFLKETDDASKTAQFLGRITKNIEKMLKVSTHSIFLFFFLFFFFLFFSFLKIF